MRLVATVIAVIALGAASSIAAAGTSALFIGNSFTYGWGSPVRFYRAHTVTDLNGEGIGGVPRTSKALLSKLAWNTTCTGNEKRQRLGLPPREQARSHRDAAVGHRRDARTKHVGSANPGTRPH